MAELGGTLALLLILAVALSTILGGPKGRFGLNALGDSIGCLFRPLHNCVGGSLNCLLGVVIGCLVLLGSCVFAMALFQQSCNSLLGIQSVPQQSPPGSSSSGTQPFVEPPQLPEPPTVPRLPQMPSADVQEFCLPVKDNIHGRQLQYSGAAGAGADHQYSTTYLGTYLPGDGCEVGDGCHPGWDIRTGFGMAVYSVAEATVKKVRHAPTEAWGWGSYVTIEVPYENRSIYFTYAHLSEIHVVQGQKVYPYIHPKAVALGLTGRSGTKHAHLHFQGDKVWHGAPWFPPGATGKSISSPQHPVNQTVYLDEALKTTFDPLLLVLYGQEPPVERICTIDVQKLLP